MFRGYTIILCLLGGSVAASEIELRRIGSYLTELTNQGAAEIVTHDPATQRLFFINGAKRSIDVLDFRNPRAPRFLGRIELGRFGSHANSVAFKNGVLTAAVEATVKTDAGAVVFFDADGRHLNSLRVGALPDMVTFTPDGRKLLVANEGERSDDGAIDPEGSVSIIHLDVPVRDLNESHVTSVSFGAFNLFPLDPAVRVDTPPGFASVDFEPEFIAVSADSHRAWVTLQENNAVASIDLKSGLVFAINGLSYAPHLPAVASFYPDAIASFNVGGRDYLITANEGEPRDLAEMTVGSVSVWSADLELAYESGPVAVNARPEGLAIGTHLGETYAFIGFEGLGGVLTWNVSTPSAPRAVHYISPPEDLGPEGLHFISAEQGPTGEPLVIVGNEVSGSIGIFQIYQIER
jgi:hypothetical protein